MAELVLLTPQFTINAQNLTSYVRSATLSYEGDAQEITASGDGTREYLGGLKQWSVSLELNQDYAADKVDDELFPIVGTVVAFTLKATDAATGPTNPEYQGNVILTSYTPIGGAIGDALQAPISLQGSGTLTRATA